MMRVCAHRKLGHYLTLKGNLYAFYCKQLYATKTEPPVVLIYQEYVDILSALKISSDSGEVQFMTGPHLTPFTQDFCYGCNHAL